MAVKKVDDEIKLFNEKDILKQNKTKIELLNNNSLFKHQFTNKIVSEFVLYLCNSYYNTLNNPEPLDLSKNTLSKSLARLKVIDDYVKKPLDKYGFTDMNHFISDFSKGKIKNKGNKKFNPKAIGGYVRDFKRLWKVYKEYTIQNNPKKYSEIFFSWGLNLRPPKNKKEYEEVPEITLEQIKHLCNNLANDDYKLRVLLSINLMARKCEIQNLKVEHLTKINSDYYIKLPRIKKNSTEKVAVALFTYVKEKTLEYIKSYNLTSKDFFFKTNETAFAKNLKEVSKKLLNKSLTPKLLRKISVGIYRDAKYSRDDVERIGGWEFNSPVVNHYFSRKKVDLKNSLNSKMSQSMQKDVYEEVDQLKRELKTQREEYEGAINELHQFKDLLFDIIAEDNKKITKKDIIEVYKKNIKKENEM